LRRSLSAFRFVARHGAALRGGPQPGRPRASAQRLIRYVEQFPANAESALIRN